MIAEGKMNRFDERMNKHLFHLARPPRFLDARLSSLFQAGLSVYKD
jgi:hypothetical protein